MSAPPNMKQNEKAPAGKAPRKNDRTHEENQERAYVAASRRADRSPEARLQSARMASEIHRKRTGKGYKITEEIVMNEEMYEEEDDEFPRQFRVYGPPTLNNRAGIYPDQVAMANMMRQEEIHRQFAEIFPQHAHNPQLSHPQWMGPPYGQPPGQELPVVYPVFHHPAPPHSAPHHSAPHHSAPSHSAPSHSAPPHSAPPHSETHHSANPHSEPHHSAPPHSVPRHSAPHHSETHHSAAYHSALQARVRHDINFDPELHSRPRYSPMGQGTNMLFSQPLSHFEPRPRSLDLHRSPTPGLTPGSGMTEQSTRNVTPNPFVEFQHNPQNRRSNSAPVDPVPSVSPTLACTQKETSAGSSSHVTPFDSSAGINFDMSSLELLGNTITGLTGEVILPETVALYAEYIQLGSQQESPQQESPQQESWNYTHFPQSDNHLATPSSQTQSLESCTPTPSEPDYLPDFSQMQLFPTERRPPNNMTAVLPTAPEAGTSQRNGNANPNPYAGSCADIPIAWSNWVNDSDAE